MFPYTCDALLYHLPFATGALIAANVVAFIAFYKPEFSNDSVWVLGYGIGLHPIQWLLSPFMHGGIEHLLGNMMFLWTFGLVTEGKLGWWRFLAVYLGIAVGQSALEQAIFPLIAPDVPYTLGASAAIFGLVAMACIWAPINQLSIFMLLMFRPFTFEVSVVAFAGFYVGLDLLFCFLLGQGAIGSATHLTGAAMGALLGVVLLKFGVVECEDNDLLSVFSGVYGMEKTKQREAAETAAKVVERTSDQTLEMRRRFDAYLKIGQPQEALATLQRARHRKIPLETNRGDLVALIAGLQKEKLWAESAPVMAELLERFPEGSQGVRIKLAQVCLVELAKPGKALELISTLDGVQLAPPLAAARDKLQAVAKRKLGEGELEVDDEAW